MQLRADVGEVDARVREVDLPQTSLDDVAAQTTTNTNKKKKKSQTDDERKKERKKGGPLDEGEVAVLAEGFLVLLDDGLEGREISDADSDREVKVGLEGVDHSLLLEDGLLGDLSDQELHDTQQLLGLFVRVRVRSCNNNKRRMNEREEDER